MLKGETHWVFLAIHFDLRLLIVLTFHKQVIDNAQHFSGKCDGNILLSAPCKYPLEESLQL